MNKNITDIFFDLDHTLWDFDKNSALTFEKIFRVHNVEVDTSEFLKHYEPINLNYWKLFREEKIDKANLRYKRLYDTFEAINFSANRTLIDQLSEDYIAHLSSFNHLFDGTLDILDYLKPNYNLHIITNGFHEVQHNKLRNANINNYFKTVTNSEMVGVKKPNPKIFDHALNLAKTTKEQSLMIGDNYEADILGALNFGMDAICFNYHDFPLERNIKKVDSLLELKNYL
ncbi:YjjG family noncanonical pyrimidine nucleotidase [Oceanihabitans sediminis]|uniref:Noncanonical pyrimidine nucleotidase, YjjG family n=1 Tax=Oceanihabitans sediminis TaxID=1812012 RepID=A0A368PC70_9FLAO|nr:YjjG family noncanonical pyrimidine nucleotidase [Oceanihabitans sediminis]MDX1278444.1 YjjG family noncanonical pyrimidine nucleotidase [Oceanihabitans sediminis]MDX1773803.1 YjjG family noncanonical pyrimidine nucleotidase [Oceanihabitans sediminis]RBP32173.1 putative hydrolase of the HAD superfamily [Oceanihabitans sediminis]RCU58821.1 noncanonical pyrimidine nucleotidase, YjjG family [Oceanihabitans sediminis]